MKVVWFKKRLSSESKTRFSKKMPYVGEFATWDLSFLNRDFTVMAQFGKNLTFDFAHIYTKIFYHKLCCTYTKFIGANDDLISIAFYIKIV